MSVFVPHIIVRCTAECVVSGSEVGRRGGDKQTIHSGSWPWEPVQCDVSLLYQTDYRLLQVLVQCFVSVEETRHTVVHRCPQVDTWLRPGRPHSTDKLSDTTLWMPLKLQFNEGFAILSAFLVMKYSILWMLASAVLTTRHSWEKICIHLSPE